VVVVFCTNDYGDTALPYDFRYPFRVYQPFYDAQGELLFNARVPRRPSLAMRGKPLGSLCLWYAFDQLEALARDVTYARHGLPNARTPGVEPRLFADFFFDSGLKRRFPYVEQTVLSLYARMHAAARAAGARFAVLPSIDRVPPKWETVDSRMRDKLQARGVTYLDPPASLTNYSPWTSTWRDGHPNFIWALLLAERLARSFDGTPPDADWSRLPQRAGLRSSLDLADTAAVARQVTESWGDADDGGRPVEGRAGLVLRAPAAGATRLRLVGRAAQPTTLLVTTPERPDAPCRLTFTADESLQTCPLPPPARPGLLFVLLTPEPFESPVRARLARAEVVPGP
jgi:hypothetical protein